MPPPLRDGADSSGGAVRLFGASWKMHMTHTDARAYCRALRSMLADGPAHTVFILPPFTAIAAAAEELAGSGIGWGAQDVHPDDWGAHTGDVSAPMLAALGCQYVEIGHSERRREHGETPDTIGRKLAAVLRWGMTPVLCVGETNPIEVPAALAEVIASLERSVHGLGPEQLDEVIIAYEPVWAIGAGSSAASPARVQAVHRGLRSWLRARGDGGAPSRIIYGGSVDGTTAPALLAQSEVDGLFIGRHALDPAAFSELIRA